MEEQNIKLTKLTKCAGCGAKVGAGVLAQLLEGIRVHHDPICWHQSELPYLWLPTCRRITHLHSYPYWQIHCLAWKHSHIQSYHLLFYEVSCSQYHF